MTLEEFKHECKKKRAHYVDPEVEVNIDIVLQLIERVEQFEKANLEAIDYIEKHKMLWINSVIPFLKSINAEFGSEVPLR